MHKVVILDGSGSMQGEKYNNAELGVKQDYEACKKEFNDYLLVEFSNYNTSVLYNFTTPLKFKPSYGGTALYDTIVQVFTTLLNTPKDEKVLVQIFTDGEDLHSMPQSKSQAKKLIEQFNSKGWTVTFVGTKEDVEDIQMNLSIDSTNTLVHDNTAQGITRSFEAYTVATKTFTKNVAEGKETTRGFFKDINNG
jgi:uncharacterized protein with von Willebrand factor type A (vWA) domain